MRQAHVARGPFAPLNEPRRGRSGSRTRSIARGRSRRPIGGNVRLARGLLEPRLVQPATNSTPDVVSRFRATLDALAAGLAKMQRDDLLEACVEPMRRTLEQNPEPDAALRARFRDGIAEIKACLLDPSRPPSPEVFEAFVEPAQGAEADDAPAESVDEAAALLAGLAGADDDELLGVLDAIDEEPGGPSNKVKDELGTLREPLMGAGAKDGAQPRVAMKGELAPGLLSDLIQLLAQNKETGRLLIEDRDDKISGSLYFVEGHLADARCGGEAGEKGFYNVMRIRKGRFYYQRGVAVEEKRITRATQHLILDTLRMIDEAS
jgi:hypothetical protein